MSRFLTRRMLGIHVMALAAVVVCLFAAHWQWQRAHTAQGSDTSSSSIQFGSFSQLSPLRQYLPASSIGVSTSVSGTWLDHGRVVLTERIAQGSSLRNPNPGSQSIVSWALPICNWIADPLVLEDKSVLMVVQGCSATPQAVPLPSGSATVTGVLQPSEDADIVDLVVLPNKLTTSSVVASLSMSVHDGYLVSSQAASGLTRVTPIFTSSPHIPLHWRNIFYVFNWIVFALIVMGMWVRVVQDELRPDTAD